MLEQYREAVEARLRTILPEEEMPPLSAAMRYSLLAGGKRLRPCMLLAAVAMLGEDWHGALEYACALEMIHTYSLIHDDLPAMDNDTLRRGKPTNHVVFGEGQAVLAGDGLLNCAYERMLADALAHPSSLERRVAAMAEIARGAGMQNIVVDRGSGNASANPYGQDLRHVPGRDARGGPVLRRGRGGHGCLDGLRPRVRLVVPVCRRFAGCVLHPSGIGQEHRQGRG